MATKDDFPPNDHSPLFLSERAGETGEPDIASARDIGRAWDSADISSRILKATLKTHARTADAVETMLQRYLAREMGKVLPMQAEMIRAQGLDPSAMESFRHALLTVRNPRMRDAALPILAKGDAFIAVGALHLIGENGLVALLRQAGYEVTPVE